MLIFGRQECLPHFIRQRAVDGVHRQGFERAGEGGDFGLGGDHAQTEARVFALAGLRPGTARLAIEPLQPISRDVLAEAELRLVGQFRVGGQRLDEPLQDALGDLANAGLRDADFVGDRAGAGVSTTRR